MPSSHDNKYHQGHIRKRNAKVDLRILQMVQDNKDPQKLIWKSYAKVTQELRLKRRNLRVLEMAWSQGNKDPQDYIWERYTKDPRI